MLLWNKPTTRSKRYQYCDDDLFERSLDVYKPIVANELHAREIAARNLPVVVLVVGSGWVGHRALVYSMTSWWNSSGPKTIASLGCTCVCIRHRGAFCSLPPAPVITEHLVLLFAILGAVTQGRWELAVGVTALVASMVALFGLGARGSASFDDMLDDVSKALRWIDSHREVLEIEEAVKYSSASDSDLAPPSTATSLSETDSLSETSSTSGQLDNASEIESTIHERNHSNPNLRPTKLRHSNHQSTLTNPLVFGGYSSGGHVAATLLQRPELFQKQGLPNPEIIFDGILMISGMMAVRPGRITVRDKSINDVNQTISISTPMNAPRWLTDFVVRTVWGADTAKEIPSPLTQGHPPPLPHLLLGCHNEVFGLSWLDVYFCAQAFSEIVRATTGKYAKYVQVKSDHWNVLNSRELRDALQEELPKLVSSGRSKKILL